MKRPKQPSPTPPETATPIPTTDKLPENIRKVLDKLPENDRTILIENFRTILIESEESEESESFFGPLPPASMFGEYDRVVPGSAERILRMAEREQAHRIDWETKALAGEIRQEQHGQWFGLLIAVLCICGAVYLAVNGQAVIAGILAGTTALGLVGRFIQSPKDPS